MFNVDRPPPPSILGVCALGASGALTAGLFSAGPER